jgi:hypothetical protein
MFENIGLTVERLPTLAAVKELLLTLVSQMMNKP